MPIPIPVPVPVQPIVVPVAEPLHGGNMPSHNHQSTMSDHGRLPFVCDVVHAAKCNENFRTTIWTGKYAQMTLMSINAGDDVGLEIHPDTDQVLFVAEGQGVARMGRSEAMLTFQENVRPGSAIFVPAGTWHNVVNTGRTPLKLYTLYAPPHHAFGTVHKTKKDAEHEDIVS